MSDFVAERKIFAVSPEGEKFWIRLGVGKPYRLDDKSWACPVTMEGLHEKYSDGVGGDSWQALHLSLNSCHSALDHFMAKGGILYYDDSEQERFESPVEFLGKSFERRNNK